ncbi:MFS transporter (macronuclear) [Tetrahymena thermophila SB210]|uniref:MFS transporter n=1 Tax=Tetrahymena thermophila (strain SB210) TaxID=312017 RepID=Q22EH1_TETTS|nr:MFS transporter [Tetrahymena thermophila SB210]EAR83681.1 MFS transporter [Tetrahymena thermophila SB210]|eukprot:XP_001031344.1 MFS transporter [Tetrahymena thermophila SB210]
MQEIELHSQKEVSYEPQLQDQELANQLTIEEAMEKVGQKNRYQIIVTALSFLTWLITTYGYMVLPYFMSAPDFECFVDGKWSKCTEDTGACDHNIKVNILTEKSSTIAADFELYCDNRQIRVIIQSMPLFAGVIGTFFFGFFTDRYGIKLAIKTCWILGILSSTFFNFSTNSICLLVGSFGVGFSALILQNLFIIHMNELSVGQFRVMALLGMYIFWSISEMQYIWMMKVLPNWRWNMLAFYTIPFSCCIIFAFKWIHDSPRYLYQKNRSRCLQNLNLIATVNQKEQISDKQLQVYKGKMSKQYNYLDLFSYPSQRSSTIVISIVFLFVNFLYQGTQVVLNTVGSSFGENSLYVGIGELFGFAFSDLISHRIPRRMGIFYTLGATCIICMSFYFYPIPQYCESDQATCWQKYLQGFMVSLARAITSLTFGLELLLCGELYPSTLKSLGYGMNLAVGYFGTFLAPSSIDWAKENGFTPIVFIGFVSFVGNFITLFSKETLNIQAPLDIPEELQQNYTNNDKNNPNNISNQNNFKFNQPSSPDQDAEGNSQDDVINELPEKIQEQKVLNQKRN